MQFCATSAERVSSGKAQNASTRPGGGFTKFGAAALLLQTSNSFGGTIIVGNGIVKARHDRSFGNNGALTLAGGSITLRDARVSNKTLFARGQRPVTANTIGSFLNGIGFSGWLGRIELDTNLVVNSTDLCIIGGPIVGPGGLEFLGDRNQIVNATFPISNPYTFTGLTRVLCSELIVTADNPFHGPIVVGGGFDSLHEIRWENAANSGLPEITATQRPGQFERAQRHLEPHHLQWRPYQHRGRAGFRRPCHRQSHQRHCDH